jgi:hypothetical protein
MGWKSSHAKVIIVHYVLFYLGESNDDFIIQLDATKLFTKLLIECCTCGSGCKINVTWPLAITNKRYYNGNNFIDNMVYFLQRHQKVDYCDHCYYAS